MTFHIKNMGPGSFTGQLHALGETQVAGSQFKIDGPYGYAATRIERYQHLMLFCGGVGVTPMAAMLDDLYEKATSNNAGVLKSVLFVWVIQKTTPLGWFPELLPRVCQNPTAGKVQFDVQVYATRASEAEVAETAASCRSGRPKLGDIFTQFLEKNTNIVEKQRGYASVAALACGPDRMVYEVQHLARSRKMDFHKETFAF